MAEVFIAAAPGEEPQARGLAEALGVLGFSASAGAPAEADIVKTAEDAKAIVVLWSRAAAQAPWITALAVLAHERKKLVSTDFERDATPALFHTGPRADLAARDRTGFKTRFQALIVELDKLTPTKAKAEALPEALIKARAALLNRSPTASTPPWRTLGAFALGVGLLFAVGFGAGRLLSAMRAGDFLVATQQAEAAPTQARPTVRPAAQTLTADRLERQSWQDAARLIDASSAVQIKRRAESGDAFSQSVACLGHLAGAPGFLPSPTAALEHCNRAAAQHEPAGLYLSWVLHRAAPHAGLDDATARARLMEAARLGWTPAQIDYAQMLAAEGTASAQAEAGRLWLAAAEDGDPRGQFFYARWLRDSPAGPRDPAAAIPFLERAVTQSQVDALHMLATLYRDGIGAPRNEGRAKALYEQAARQTYPPSMFNLADMLRRGSAPERARAVALYAQLACMRDERQIQPMAVQRLRALGEGAVCR